MELEELEGWAASFAAFCARFDDLFAPSRVPHPSPQLAAC